MSCGRHESLSQGRSQERKDRENRTGFLGELLRSLRSYLASISRPAPSAQRTGTFDVLLTNGRIVDGTGAPWFAATSGLSATASRRSDRWRSEHGRDHHRRDEPGGDAGIHRPARPVGVQRARGRPRRQQDHAGRDDRGDGEGTSIAPVNDRLIQEAAAQATAFGVAQDWRTLGDYLRRLEERSRPAINVATFVGAGTLRNYVIGKDDRPATPAELDEMRQLAADAMKQGALGISTSLQYVPDRFASTDELVELAKVAAQYGGVYFTHQRSEGVRIFESLDEVFAIAERARIPAEIWHLKTAYKANFGKMAEVLRRIESARARGLDVTANQYPYTRASNGLDSCLPIWSREGGLDKTLERLRDPADARTHQERHGRCDGDGVGEPVVRRERRRRRHALDRAQPRAAQVRGDDAHRNRQGDGEGSSRRGDGSRHRRSR
jgi:hypothetical protein